MNILIIEDEQSIRETLRDLLEVHGHTVTEAANGLDGVLMAGQGPDIILCDIGMPGLNGHQVITAVQQQPACRDIPFIFLTARTSREDMRQGMELGADDYVTKPFTEADVIRAIDARVRRQQPLRERLEQLINGQRREIRANWSHELMTPLNGLLGGLDLIESEAGDLKVSDIKDLLDIVRGGARRQEALSRKLVLHFELEQLKANAARKQYICPAADAVLEGARRAAEEAGRGRDLTVTAERGEVLAFGSHLLAAVAEVVSNAFRYSMPGQLVTVMGRRAVNHYLIDVIDRGPGLPVEECDQVGPFVQFGREKKEQQGLGLGLAIARSVAELGGGNLTVRPCLSSRGLHVAFDLPCE